MFSLKRLTAFYWIFTTTKGKKTQTLPTLLQTDRLYRIIAGQYFSNFWLPGCVGTAVWLLQPKTFEGSLCDS